MLRRFVKYTVFLTVFITATFISYAPPPGGGWNPGNTDPTVVPIGNGFILLCFAAIFYSFIKNYRSKKK